MSEASNVASSDRAAAPVTGRGAQTLAPVQFRDRREGSRLWRRLRGNRKALLGAIFFTGLAVIAVIGPVIAPYDPDNGTFGLFKAPTFAHPFGTDSFGRDLFSRVLIGTRISLTIGVASALLAMMIGVTLGVLSGYYGRWVDTLIMRYIDLQWAFPVLILNIGLVAVFGAGARNLIIAIGISYITGFTRIVRAEVMKVRRSDYATAASAIGASDTRIIIRHILPNVAAPIIVQVTFAVALGILAEAGLTFLGLGVNPSTPTWGLLLNESRDFMRRAWWISVFPGLAIMTTVMALNLFGDGLRDVLDVVGGDDA